MLPKKANINAIIKTEDAWYLLQCFLVRIAKDRLEIPKRSDRRMTDKPSPVGVIITASIKAKI